MMVKVSFFLRKKTHWVLFWIKFYDSLSAKKKITTFIGIDWNWNHFHYHHQWCDVIEGSTHIIGLCCCLMCETKLRNKLLIRARKPISKENNDQVNDIRRDGKKDISQNYVNSPKIHFQDAHKNLKMIISRNRKNKTHRLTSLTYKFLFKKKVKLLRERNVTRKKTSPLQHELKWPRGSWTHTHLSNSLCTKENRVKRLFLFHLSQLSFVFFFSFY